jgi:hypothetical protein
MVTVGLAVDDDVLGVTALERRGACAVVPAVPLRAEVSRATINELAISSEKDVVRGPFKARLR